MQNLSMSGLDSFLFQVFSPFYINRPGLAIVDEDSRVL